MQLILKYLSKAVYGMGWYLVDRPPIHPIADDAFRREIQTNWQEKGTSVDKQKCLKIQWRRGRDLNSRTR